jgi:hypothetical protein
MVLIVFPWYITQHPTLTLTPSPSSSRSPSSPLPPHPSPSLDPPPLLPLSPADPPQARRRPPRADPNLSEVRALSSPSSPSPPLLSPHRPPHRPLDGPSSRGPRLLAPICRSGIAPRPPVPDRRGAFLPASASARRRYPVLAPDLPLFLLIRARPAWCLAVVNGDALRLSPPPKLLALSPRRVSVVPRVGELCLKH